MAITRNADAFPATGLAASVAQAMAEAQAETWANLKTRTGAYDGELLRLPRMDGVLGESVFMHWSSTLAKWCFLGRQKVARLAKVVGSAGTTFSVTVPNVVLKGGGTGGGWWVGTKIEIITAFNASNNSCTAAPVNQSIGGTAIITDTQATVRRKKFSRQIECYATGAAGQFCHGKVDNFYAPFSNDNSAPIALSLDLTADFTIATDVSTGWTNASSSTLTLQELDVFCE
jgi:hypothetical protein